MKTKFCLLILTILLTSSCNKIESWEDPLATYKCSDTQMKKVHEEVEWELKNVKADKYADWYYANAIKRNCSENK